MLPFVLVNVRFSEFSTATFIRVCLLCVTVCLEQTLTSWFFLVQSHHSHQRGLSLQGTRAPKVVIRAVALKLWYFSCFTVRAELLWSDDHYPSKQSLSSWGTFPTWQAFVRALGEPFCNILPTRLNKPQKKTLITTLCSQHVLNSKYNLA